MAAFLMINLKVKVWPQKNFSKALVELPVPMMMDEVCSLLEATNPRPQSHTLTGMWWFVGTTNDDASASY